jgi:hypothetical protein
VAARLHTNAPVVIDEGAPEGSGDLDLVAAAAAERKRRLQAGPSTLVVNDKNLAQHATGNLTISGVAPPATPKVAPAAGGEVKDAAYWRGRVHGLREQWALAVDTIGELESRAANLRTRFYAQDDPYVRDGEIKPAWDRALENLEAARLRAKQLEEQLGSTLEEGRMAGALPGWLRDGIELEPAERPYNRPEQKVLGDDSNLVREPEELGEPPHR